MSLKKIKEGLFDPFALILGGICLTVCLISLAVSGTPYDAAHRLDGIGVIPPLWIWRLVLMIWSFLAGAAAGAIVSSCTVKKLGACQEAQIYKGAVFLTVAFFLFILHYPLLFCCERLLLSLVASLTAVACAVICGGFWSKVNCFAAVTVIGFAFWLTYTTFITACLLVSN